MTTILGIESTAHTFGVAVVRDGRVLSNCRKTYTTDSGGIIPLEAAKHHDKIKDEIYSEALEKSGVKEEKIDAIAFSQGPGLSPCLLVGLKFTKSLASKLKKPIVPVNHCIAHLEIGRTTGAKDPVMLYTSGANTQVIAYASGKFRIFGETLDVGVGNFIDNFARLAEMGFPGGPRIEELALKGKNFVELPYKVKGMDIALSGILTNLKQKIDRMKNSDVNRNLRETSSRDKKIVNQKSAWNIRCGLSVNSNLDKSEHSEVNYNLEDLAFSLQENVFAMLVETAERALAHTGKKELLLGGGVACNLRLQEMCRVMCEERGAKFFCPEKQFLIDNAGMIAYLGEIIFNRMGTPFPSQVTPSSTRTPRLRDEKSRRKGDFKTPRRNRVDKFSIRPPTQKEMTELDIKPRQRTDDVEVTWR